MRDGAPVIAPGAHDLLTTKLVARQGFQAVYLGSYGSAASRWGLPDQSVVTMSELLEQARLMVEATDLPVIADLEEGGGNAVNTFHQVRRFEAAGVAGMHIEDHVPGKLYGPGGALHPISVATEKIRAALEARRDPDTLVIARCEAIYIGRTLEEATERCQAYAEAGADMLLVTGLPLAETPLFAKIVGKPMAGFVLDDAKEAVIASGIKLAIYPFQSVVVTYLAMKTLMRELYDSGAVTSFGNAMPAAKELEQLVGAEEGSRLAKRYKIV
jgi:2-methylisocitrate lyase-like PEP mutase family enzyme